MVAAPIPAPCGCTFEPAGSAVPGRIVDWCPAARALSWYEQSPATYRYAAYCAHVDAARQALQRDAAPIHGPVAPDEILERHAYTDCRGQPTGMVEAVSEINGQRIGRQLAWYSVQEEPL